MKEENYVRQIMFDDIRLQRNSFTTEDAYQKYLRIKRERDALVKHITEIEINVTDIWDILEYSRAHPSIINGVDNIYRKIKRYDNLYNDLKKCWNKYNKHFSA